MRVLLIAQDFPPDLSGGIAEYYYNLGKFCNGSFELLVPNSEHAHSFDKRQTFQIHRQRIPLQAPLSKRKTMPYFVRVLRPFVVMLGQFILFTWSGWGLLRKHKFDAVMIGHLHLGLVGLLLRNFTGCRYGFILHGGELDHYWQIGIIRAILLFTLNQADFLITNSCFTKQQYIKRGVHLTQKIQVIYPGVNTKHFHPKHVTSIHPFQEDPHTKLILSVSRLVERKGHDTVLKALSHLIDRNDWVYLIAGTGTEQPRLQLLATELNIANRVKFLGFVPDIDLPSLYAQADLFVMPSRAIAGAEGIEGFGIVYLEAAASGIPSIAGKSGGASEAVLNGITGIIVNPNDVDEVANSIDRLLSDSDLRLQLGKQAYERVVQELDWSIQTAKLQEFLQSL